MLYPTTASTLLSLSKSNLSWRKFSNIKICTDECSMMKKSIEKDDADGDGWNKLASLATLTK